MSVAVVHNSSEEGRKALGSAVQQARSAGTELVVLHAFSGSADPSSEAKETTAVEDSIRTSLAALGESEAQWTLAAAQPDPDATTTLLALIDKADAELLVVGSRHRSAVGKFLMGQAVQRLLLETPVPVLLVKS
ncbi:MULTISPECIES: universal stress protein [unclassified Rhodococcus (in: high G+C Gram-positive bacteria)]|jgi:hypothetical protein|uniref:universal stress protein n=1 Tax=unclassified Rhodococcus (in: high G+C Gram-positive bacteria) TaxID=192944 RepID=UPI0004846619|nr:MULTISPECIES: universal stress protein [unclassified Rhodococcus (in: high G+C Gram-positive bacteria)]